LVRSDYYCRASSAAVSKGKEYIGSAFNQITPAYADTGSGDSPLMPMGFSNDSGSGSDLGCFIQVISEEVK